MYKRTKNVCTMGPACDNDETLREMMKAGMNVARFNFSHGSYEEHHGRIERVRRIAAELDMTIGILLDTKGPEVRTGLLKDHQKISVKAGDKIVVTAAPTSEDFLGDAATSRSTTSICPARPRPARASSSTTASLSLWSRALRARICTASSRTTARSASARA